ncbi:hypothetical protein BKN38_05945 [Helicobacter sp. CLO-3]|uniref:hypothetical protein n=1 Tax=unclassified Helicobacter TaxID=2593540 RepID=UPI000805CED0|nr:MULTISPECIES: hypothetical protein [unclassified Helicobacter]OBV29489.1 hypothetical protein BA723_05425 [Helicobacter sp. CLO-3]OHU83077.1 hypothetical protein BKN38_05945 [Helicobacter sp. CLO-3]
MNDKEPSKENLNSAQNKKYDKNGDEIIWEYEGDSKVWFCIVVAVHMIYIYTFYRLTIDQAANWVNPGFGHYVAFLGLFLIMFAYPLYSIFRLFNQKAVYATKDKLIFKKYLGKTKTLSLELPIYGLHRLLRCPHSTTDFYILSNKGRLFRVAYIIHVGQDESIRELYKNILLPRVKEYYLNVVDDKEAAICRDDLLDSDFKRLIDLKALENERQERLKNDKSNK